MGSYTPEPQKLWIETPCIPSTALSQAAGCNIFLKLENLQPSGSFKSRGIGHMMQRALAAHRAGAKVKKPDGGAEGEAGVVHFYCSSGGNAGLACATAAAALGRSRCTCTVVVPLMAPEHMVAKLRLLGAEVHQVGAHWALADAHLREELLSRDPHHGVYIPPFDHPDIWEGVSSIVDELAAQMAAFVVGRGGGEDSGDIDGLVCSVGGGGLLNGIMEGVEKQKWGPRGGKPRVLAVETVGTDSLNQSVRAGELVTLPAITSVATSLGASRVSERTLEWTRRADYLTSHVVSDADAVAGSVKFANDARMLVEVACGATVAPVYNGDLRKVLGAGLGDEEWRRKNIVLVVCGGSNVTLEMLRAYQEKFGVD
ncbi:hypothetical protein DL766_009812 [Monosporascus sp. MC13-8B]|uniref:L-serine ammonia-lyase n=1 Tax=Monosporascus cannonballus TaxID=155416 RepID=A0ABY0GRH5_9PEZI|nr:hypothetical protein DL762_010478 [Monosporascus cannonballus]RYO78698.1 hypothetical protein DL763_009542 [Monosporascus cannonballus]RYP13762.1 hypothetical protein DL766_009812 [Monosporascus sp. MC13-8B]